jgi:hypothetical protein
MSKLKDLKVWEAELRAEQAALSKQLEPLLNQRDELRTKIELVQKLVAMESDPGTPSDVKLPATLTAAAELQAVVREILEERSEPMHISDIRVALLGRGFPIPGKGTDANIIVHLRRAPHMFSKSGRGTYGLKNSGNGTRPNAK